MTTLENVQLTPYELELFAYHVGSIYRDTGKFGLSCRTGILAEVVIEPRTDPKQDMIWDQVTINGHWCGNRAGGARAYAKMVAGDPHWWKP